MVKYSQSPSLIRLIVVLLLPSLLILLGLGLIFPPRKGRVIVVGLDSLSPREVAFLMGEGQAPNFRWIAQHGYWGRLHTDLSSLSRIVWPMIETGQPPEMNGITAKGNTAIEFRVDGMRRVPSVWNIASEARETVAIWNPYESHPASPVHGIFVSDRWQNPVLGKLTEGVYYPYAFGATLADRIAWGVETPVFPNSVRFISDGLGWNTEFLSKIDFEEYFEKKVFALKVEFEGMVPLAARLSEGYDLTYFYSNTSDVFSHMLIQGGSEGKARFETLYRVCDAAVGCFLDNLGPQDHLIVVSDHGFNPIPAGPNYSVFIKRKGTLTNKEFLAELYRDPEENLSIAGVTEETDGWRVWLDKEGNPLRLRRLVARLDLAYGEALTDTELEHSHNDTGISGVFGLIGPGITHNVGSGEKPHVLNITPMILYLLDIPSGSDMEGGIVKTVFQPGYLKSHPVKTIPTWGTRTAATNAQLSAEHLAEMKTLGYIQ